MLLTPCIEWHLSRTKKGYGQVRYNGKMMKAHRVALLKAGVDLKPEDIVRHECDNRGCVNIEHLIVGDTQANTLDKVMRGPRGPKLKLTPEDVYVIRRRVATGLTDREIAAEYNVHPNTITYIRKGRTWSHLK